LVNRPNEPGGHHLAVATEIDVGADVSGGVLETFDDGTGRIVRQDAAAVAPAGEQLAENRGVRAEDAGNGINNAMSAFPRICRADGVEVQALKRPVGHSAP
jgi:glycosyltransferase involved in cell wall biosynthesis